MHLRSRGSRPSRSLVDTNNVITNPAAIMFGFVIRWDPGAPDGRPWSDRAGEFGERGGHPLGGRCVDGVDVFDVVTVLTGRRPTVTNERRYTNGPAVIAYAERW